MSSQQGREISQEQWNLWLQDPATLALREWARSQREDRRDMWEGAAFKVPDYIESAVRDSAALGACSVYREIEALDFETVIGAMENVSAKRVEDGPRREKPDLGGY